jgi:hypothetical protein
MHWEKVPLEEERIYEDGRHETVDLAKQQLQDLLRQDIPVRFVRTKHKDGSESIHLEKQVQD